MEGLNRQTSCQIGSQIHVVSTTASQLVGHSISWSTGQQGSQLVNQ